MSDFSSDRVSLFFRSIISLFLCRKHVKWLFLTSWGVKAGGCKHPDQRVQAETGQPRGSRWTDSSQLFSAAHGQLRPHPNSSLPRHHNLPAEMPPLHASCFSDAQRMSGLIAIHSVIMGLTATCSKGKPLNKGFALVFWKGKQKYRTSNHIIC